MTEGPIRGSWDGEHSFADREAPFEVTTPLGTVAVTLEGEVRLPRTIQVIFQKPDRRDPTRPTAAGERQVKRFPLFHKRKAIIYLAGQRLVLVRDWPKPHAQAA